MTSKLTMLQYAAHGSDCHLVIIVVSLTSEQMAAVVSRPLGHMLMIIILVHWVNDARQCNAVESLKRPATVTADGLATH